MSYGGREAGKDLQGRPHSHETEPLEIPVSFSHVPSGLERGENMAAVRSAWGPSCRGTQQGRLLPASHSAVDACELRGCCSPEAPVPFSPADLMSHSCSS